MSTAAEPTRPRRPVMRYALGGAIGILTGALIATPAVLLSFKKWAEARMRVGTYDTEINGSPVSIDSIIGWSTLLSLPIIIAALLMLSHAIGNCRKNLRDKSPSPAHENLETAR